MTAQMDSLIPISQVSVRVRPAFGIRVHTQLPPLRKSEILIDDIQYRISMGKLSGEVSAGGQDQRQVLDPKFLRMRAASAPVNIPKSLRDS